MEVNNNDNLKEILVKFRQDKSVENYNSLIEKLIKANILMPAQLIDKKPYPSLIKSGAGDSFLGVYTDKDQIPENQREGPIIGSPFMVANKMVMSSGDNIKGIVVNPFTDNIILQVNLPKRIVEVEARRNIIVNKNSGIENLGKVVADEKGNKALVMNEEQYNQFERTQFEVSYIPTELFTKGQEFIDQLVERREDYIDEMYEASYKNKRMYPYFTEDFSVMPINLSEELLLIRVDMPEKSVLFGNAFRIYIYWNSTTKEGRYFRIVQGKTKGQILFEEISKDKKAVQLGDAPVEGTEIKAISDLVGFEL